MASDLKLEIFASFFFETQWYLLGYLSHKLGVLSLYPEEYHLDPEVKEIWDDSYLMAVAIKHMFYYCVFFDEFANFIHDFEPSPWYISDYISSACARDGLFGDQSVFELLLSSCAFVLYLCKICVKAYDYKDVLSYVHLCWAMYFDEYKEEFYRQGGWNQLKIVSNSYVLGFEIMGTLPPTMFNSDKKRRACIHIVMKAAANYKTFKSFSHDNCKTLSKAWVKFHLQNIYNSDASDITGVTQLQDMMHSKAVEQLLLQFRRLCDPSSSETLDIKEEYEYSDYGKKTVEKVSQQLSKLNILTNDITRKMTCNSYTRERELEHQRTDDPSNELTAIDLTQYKQNDNQVEDSIPMDLSRGKPIDDETDKPTAIYLSHDKRNEDNTVESIATNLSLNKDTTSKDESQNTSILQLKSTLKVGFPWNETHTNEQKFNEAHKKEIDVERESPETKCLLRMILVLGNSSGIIHVRSSLPSSNTHQRKNKSKE